MKIEITEEQVDYIKSLHTSKNKKEFLLSAIIENIVGKSRKISYLPNTETEEINRLNTQYTTHTSVDQRLFENSTNNKEDEFIKFNALEESQVNSDADYLKFFERNRLRKEYLSIDYKILLKEQRYVLAKIFKNQIEILELFEEIEKKNSEN